MRYITDHKVNGLNEALTVAVIDEPGQGGANHRYEIALSAAPNPDRIWGVDFQNGPIKEAGFNGLSQESLLVVVIDRLRSFQAGPYACRENALALTYCEEALMWLQKRTLDRMKRGVEGTDTK